VLSQQQSEEEAEYQPEEPASKKEVEAPKPQKANPFAKTGGATDLTKKSTQGKKDIFSGLEKKSGGQKRANPYA